MIFVTGDTHGGDSYDARKLNTKQWPEQKACTREDTLIIAGDFGYLWDNGVADQHWLNHLSTKKPTICFVDGNHENFDLLNSFPVMEWNGGRVHQIRENVFHQQLGRKPSPLGVGRNAEVFNSVKDKKEDFWVK